MAGRRRKRKIPEEIFTVQVDSFSHDGKGVARVDGMATFIDGALPGETVEFKYTSIRRDFAEAKVYRVIKASELRTEPKCEYFGVCGGCSIQHLVADQQIHIKQQLLQEQLSRIGKLDRVAPWSPLKGPLWGYRHKARLGVKYVAKKNRVLVGYREKGNSFLADMRSCATLHPKIGEKLNDFSELISLLSIRSRIPQIEVAVGEFACAVVFRTLDPATDEDRQKFADFGECHGFDVYLQSGGPDTVEPINGVAKLLSYSLPAHDIVCQYEPLQFTQVNVELNRKMVERALQLLRPTQDDRVIDLFCGIGNFTLALARCADQVVGVEGDKRLVAQAESNAAANGLANIAFHTANLETDFVNESWAKQKYSLALLDPSRAGAQNVLKYLFASGVQRIVYVSCNPSTLARDAGILVNELGYDMSGVGVMDMFPQTSHVESIALFER